MRAVAVVLALLVVSACTGVSGTPAPAAVDLAAVAANLVLREEVTAPKGLVRDGEPVAGVQKLVECPELASAGQAVAGITAKWTWSHGSQRATVTQYAAVYRGVTGREVVQQARAASGCHRNSDEYWTAPGPVGELYFFGDDLGSTKPFVDDRFAYYVSNVVSTLSDFNNADRHTIHTALQAKQDKVIRLTIDITGPVEDLDTLRSSTFAQAVTDRLVA